MINIFIWDVFFKKFEYFLIGDVINKKNIKMVDLKRLIKYTFLQNVFQILVKQKAKY